MIIFDFTDKAADVIVRMEVASKEMSKDSLTLLKESWKPYHIKIDIDNTVTLAYDLKSYFVINFSKCNERDYRVVRIVVEEENNRGQ